MFIPDGNFELQEKDVISVVASSRKANDFFKKIGMTTNRIKTCMIIGGGETTYYLAKGLEFDQVFVLGGEKESPLFQQFRYICATRALHELYVYDFGA